MTLALMQPYLFPYLGYFQLVSACDLFVIFDNVAFTKHRWINRNRILEKGEPRWLTLPVAHQSHALCINSRTYKLDDYQRRKTLRTIASTYSPAPQFDQVYPLIQRVMEFQDPNIAAFNTNALVKTLDFLEVPTKIVVASEVERSSGFTGQERVVEICRQLGASRYINAIGGLDLYQPDAFAAAGVELMFLQPNIREYLQFDLPFVPSLSIVDVLMFNSAATVRGMLADYDVIHPANQKHDRSDRN